MFVIKDIAVGIAAILLGIFIIFQSQGLIAKTSLDPAGPTAIPLMMAWAMIALGIIHIIGGMFARKKAGAKDDKKSAGASLRAFLDRYRLVIVVILLGLAFYALFDILGYLIAIPLLYGSILWTMGKRDLKSVVGFNLAMTAILFIVFRFGLSVDLPLGPFAYLF